MRAARILSTAIKIRTPRIVSSLKTHGLTKRICHLTALLLHTRWVCAVLMVSGLIVYTYIRYVPTLKSFWQAHTSQLTLPPNNTAEMGSQLGAWGYDPSVCLGTPALVLLNVRYCVEQHSKAFRYEIKLNNRYISTPTDMCTIAQTPDSFLFLCIFKQYIIQLILGKALF